MSIREAWKSRWCAALVVGIVSTQAAMADPVLSIVASPNPVTVGSPLGVNINISGAVDVYSYQFTLTFSGSSLSGSTATEGTFLLAGGTTFFGGGTLSPNTLSSVFDTIIGPGSGVNGSGTLARINFGTLSAGTSTLTLSNVIVLNSSLATLPTTMTGATVSVVPEPATYAMFGAGLAGLLLAARRRQAAA